MLNRFNSDAPDRPEVPMFSLLLAVIYLTFISLGLPDGLLGAAWPVMHVELGAPVAAQSVISIIISGCTIVSSLATARLVARLGSGRLCAISVALTAIAILGFSQVTAFWQLCLLALPYGLGAGAIDSALNNYVALNYGQRHMSWLHCCWGVGATAGPVVMGWALGSAFGWPAGYVAIGAAQVAITFVLFMSLPLWKREASDGAAPDASTPDGAAPDAFAVSAGPDVSETPAAPDVSRAPAAFDALTVSVASDASAPASSDEVTFVDLADRDASVDQSDRDRSIAIAASTSPVAPVDPDAPTVPTNRELLRLPGAKAAIGSFGVYCALEGSTGLWIASYLVMARGVDPAVAASIVSLFFLGITVGRFLSGVVASWLNSEQQIRVGLGLIACGLVLLFVVPGADLAWLFVGLIGLGCAPIYPSIVALTPHRFGERASQGLVSLQMACAYTGSSVMPPLFGLVAGAGYAGAIPWMLLALLVAEVILSELACSRSSSQRIPVD